MASRRTTQKELRRYVQLGLAQDITYASFDEINKILKDNVIETVAYSVGRDSLNGALFQSRTTGLLYAVIGHTTSLVQMI